MDWETANSIHMFAFLKFKKHTRDSQAITMFSFNNMITNYVIGTSWMLLSSPNFPLSSQGRLIKAPRVHMVLADNDINRMFWWIKCTVDTHLVSKHRQSFNIIMDSTTEHIFYLKNGVNNWGASSPLPCTSWLVQKWPCSSLPQRLCPRECWSVHRKDLFWPAAVNKGGTGRVRPRFGRWKSPKEEGWL